jgi:hypothetical protein
MEEHYMRNRARVELAKISSESARVLEMLLTDGLQDVWTSIAFLVDKFDLGWHQTFQVSGDLLTLHFLANRTLPKPHPATLPPGLKPLVTQYLSFLKMDPDEN